MIQIKSAREIEKMRECGRISALAREAGKLAAMEPGVSTAHVDEIIKKTIVSYGAKPSFLGYNGYPASSNISVNDEVIHGIPSKRRLKDGDLVSIDVGAFYDGFHTDTADTICVGGTAGEASRLIEAARKCFEDGLSLALEGNRVSDISAAVEQRAKSFGYDVVHDYTGHGVGRELHEEPEVPNFDTGKRGPRLIAGMVIAIEPMITAGGHKIKLMRDGWTVVTADGRLSSHYEHTVLITSSSPELLTLVK